ncbi:hypothetical protein OH77DRAFT_132499 [Trametes cingulata]|nr:hypothetical protein OH77DRAFT_132499 [Trametes cingulata]
MFRPYQRRTEEDVEKGQGPRPQTPADIPSVEGPTTEAHRTQGAETSERGVVFNSLDYIPSAILDTMMTKKRLPKALGFRASLKEALFASGVNILLIALPFAWASHWLADDWGHVATFILCFISIIPLQYMFDWCGEQVARRTGPDLGDFIRISLKNCVEATLALILLIHCHLRLLQSTIIGVVVLHLLLVQGTAFCVGGSRTLQQQINPAQAAVNPALLMAGVLSIVLPTSFFAALDRGNAIQPLPTSERAPFSPLVSDAVRGDMLKMSRGIAIMLLIIYIASRLYRHVPWPLPCFGRKKDKKKSTAQGSGESTPEPTNAGSNQEPKKPRESGEPKKPSNPKKLPKGPAHFGACVILIVVCVGIMCATAEFLVESIDPVRERTDIQAEWFGLVLLPLVSFLPEALVVVGSFMWPLIKALRHNGDNQDGRKDGGKDVSKDDRKEGENQDDSEDNRRHGDNQDDSDDDRKESDNQNDSEYADIQDASENDPSKDGGKDVSQGDSKVDSESDDGDPMQPFAHSQPIDLSIQFTLWWMPFVVLIGWWTGRPMHLMFDYFEVVLLLGACFVVNHVTADGMTNFAEGVIMMTFYAMIATVAWFYPGQPEAAFMHSCPGSVAGAVAAGVENSLALFPL